MAYHKDVTGNPTMTPTTQQETTQDFSLEQFQWRAYILVLKLYAVMLLVQWVGLAIVGNPAGEVWHAALQLGLSSALILPLLLLSTKGPSQGQVHVFLGLATAIQVPSLFLAEPLLSLMWFTAMIAILNIMYALLSTPRAAMGWSMLLITLMCSSVLIRFYDPSSLRFSLETLSHFKLYVGYSVALLIAAMLLIRWMTTGFHKAAHNSQQMALALQANNQELAQARDEALQAARLKSALLENMSHELRTPLNAIIGYTELLQEQLEELSYTEAEDLLADTHKIHRAGSQLLTLVQQVLDLTTLDDLENDEEATSVSLLTLAQELRSQLQPMAHDNHNQLDVHVDEGLDEIATSRVRLHKILWILLENACKFTKEGHIALTISRDAEADAVHCAVKDDGIGITKEQMSRVFELFEQGDMSANKRHQGLGVGLALAAQLATRIGARLHVESEPGKGTTFTLTLPQQPDSQTT